VVDITTGQLGMGFIIKDHDGIVIVARSRTKWDSRTSCGRGIGDDRFLCNRIQQRSQSKKYFFRM